MNLAPLPVQKFFDNNGNPLVGGKLFTYVSGTSTKIATSVNAGGTPNTNPVILDFRGECRLWIDPALSYTFVLAPANDTDPPTAPIWTVNDITVGSAQQDNAADDTGPVNNIELSIPQISSPTAFTRIVFKAANTNTGPVTISINGGTAKALTLQNLDPLAGGEIQANGVYQAIYDGAQWQLQNLLGYPRTDKETAAGISPLNTLFPPGNVDRYLDNATPDTTDMAPAFNDAFAVAAQTGCTVTYGARAPYRLNSPINCTQMRGITVNDESGCNATNGNAAIIIAHTGHGFDMSASTDFVWNNLTAKNLAGTVPNSLFFIARPASGAGAGGHRFNNIHTTSACTFRNLFYTYGSEENNYSGCFLYNSQPGSAIINHNATNPSGYTSTFITIATGTQSNTTHRHAGGTYYQFGNSGSANEVVFALEGASNTTFRDGLWFCPYGLAYISVAGALSTNFLTLDSIRGEPGGADLPTDGIRVNSAVTHLFWTISNVQFTPDNYGLHFVDSADIQNLSILSSGSTSGYLLNLYSMSNSFIDHASNVVTGRAGGTVASNTFVGNRANVVLSGTNSLNTGFDQATGRPWQTGDSYSAPSAACTGAITANAAWSLTFFNREVTLILPAISATASAATNFIFGSQLPVQYRPAADMRVPCIILDNGATPNQQGYVFLFAATGNIAVYKDILSTANFTAGPGAGLPGSTEIRWTI